MEEEKVFVGIDWGDDRHAVTVYSPGSDRRRRFSVTHTAAGLKELVAQLKEAGTVEGVAVEGKPEVLVALLMEAGFKVYCVNPKLASSWREAQSVGEAKTDGGDAEMLAEQLAVQHRKLRPAQARAERSCVLARLCEDEEEFIKKRTALVQELKAVLKQYYPAVLEFFEDWTRPAAWSFVKAFPSPGALGRARKETLGRFLSARRIGMSPLWQSRVEQRGHALEWPRVPGEEAFVVRVRSLVGELQAVENSLRTYRMEIDRLCTQFTDLELFESLPGAGEKLAPRLLAMFGDDRECYKDAKAVQKLSGVAPVTEQSGRSKKVHIRRACRKHWRNTRHLLAHTSQMKCPWARAFYQCCRQRGDKEAVALRKLSYKWLKIIFRMWQTKQPYDEQKYLHSLRKSRSPLIAYMAAQNTGG